MDDLQTPSFKACSLRNGDYDDGDDNTTPITGTTMSTMMIMASMKKLTATCVMATTTTETMR